MGLAEQRRRCGGRLTNGSFRIAELHGALKVGAFLLAVAVVPSACGPGGPVLSADASGIGLFEQGERALAEEDWQEGTEAFDTLLKNYPSSPFLAEARLGLGEAYYHIGRDDSLILAVDAFETFLTYHPSHERVDFAQYMIGMCYMAQMRAPDRDQSNTVKAVQSFDEFLEIYPESDLLAEVRAQRRLAEDHLVESELRVARWQLRAKKLWEAAAQRGKQALDSYPETSLKCDLLYLLGESYREGQNWGLAVEYYQQIVNEHPDCRYASDALDRLREQGSARPAAQGVGG